MFPEKISVKHIVRQSVCPYIPGEHCGAVQYTIPTPPALIKHFPSLAVSFNVLYTINSLKPGRAIAMDYNKGIYETYYMIYARSFMLRYSLTWFTILIFLCFLEQLAISFLNNDEN